MKDLKENLKIMKIDELVKLKKELSFEKALEISSLATSGKKNSAKAKNFKRRIARVETEISAKIFQRAESQTGA